MIGNFWGEHGQKWVRPVWTLTQVFSCEICKIFKNVYFEEHLRTTAFISAHHLNIFMIVLSVKSGNLYFLLTWFPKDKILIKNIIPGIKSEPSVKPQLESTLGILMIMLCFRKLCQ